MMLHIRVWTILYKIMVLFEFITCYIFKFY